MATYYTCLGRRWLYPQREYFTGDVNCKVRILIIEIPFSCQETRSYDSKPNVLTRMRRFLQKCKSLNESPGSGRQRLAERKGCKVSLRNDPMLPLHLKVNHYLCKICERKSGRMTFENRCFDYLQAEFGILDAPRRAGQFSEGAFMTIFTKLHCQFDDLYRLDWDESFSSERDHHNMSIANVLLWFEDLTL